MLETTYTNQSEISINCFQFVRNIHSNTNFYVFLALISMYYRQKSSGNDCFYSHDQIAHEAARIARRNTEYCKETVRRALKELKKSGLVSWVDRSRDTTSNIYSVSSEIYKNIKEFRQIVKQVLGSIPAFLYVVSFRSLLGLFFALPITFVVPYKNLDLNLPCNDKESRSLIDQTRHFKKNRRKEMKAMIDAGKLKSTPLLDEIEKLLKLTKLGKAKLFCFDSHALAYSWNEVKRMNNLKDPFSCLVIRTVRYSQNKSIPIDWDIFTTIKKRYSMVDDGIYSKIEDKQMSVETLSAAEKSRPSVEIKTMTKPVQLQDGQEDIVYASDKRSYSDRFKEWKKQQNNPDLTHAQFQAYVFEGSREP